MFPDVEKPEVHGQKNMAFWTSRLVCLWKDKDESPKSGNVSCTLVLLGHSRCLSSPSQVRGNTALGKRGAGPRIRSSETKMAETQGWRKWL